VPRPSAGAGVRPVRNSSSGSGSMGAAAGLLATASNGDTQPNSPLSMQGSDEAAPDIPADLPDYCKGAARGKVGLRQYDNSARHLQVHMTRLHLYSLVHGKEGIPKSRGRRAEKLAAGGGGQGFFVQCTI
jgi:hypothetical protein